MDNYNENIPETGCLILTFAHKIVDVNGICEVEHSVETQWNVDLMRFVKTLSNKLDEIVKYEKLLT